MKHIKAFNEKLIESDLGEIEDLFKEFVDKWNLSRSETTKWVSELGQVNEEGSGEYSLSFRHQVACRIGFLIPYQATTIPKQKLITDEIEKDVKSVMDKLQSFGYTVTKMVNSRTPVRDKTTFFLFNCVLSVTFGF